MPAIRQMPRYVVIIAGGQGERFWPLSRQSRPKQLLTLLGNRSFLQQAAARARELTDIKRILVITNKDQYEQVRKQVSWLPGENIVAEPAGRDTCAAICLGAAIISAREPDAVMAVLPADHWIPKPAPFIETIQDSFALAEKLPVLITIGIKPTEPSTAYGYIRLGDSLQMPPTLSKLKTQFYHAEQFVEKPDYARACDFLASGNYKWNAGMFIWSISTLLDALWKHRPDFAEACRRWTRAAQQGRLERMLTKEYKQIEKISIDYALMEKADNVVCALGSFEWEDIGSWPALHMHLPKDQNNNAVCGLYAQLDSTGNLIYDARTKNKGLIATEGIHNSIIVLTDDAILIMAKDQAQKLRELVRAIAADKRLSRFTK